MNKKPTMTRRQRIRTLVRLGIICLAIVGLLAVGSYLLSFFGLGEKNPKLDKAALARIGQIMRSSSVPSKIHSAVNQALYATQLCTQTDALVLDALIGYLTLTRFDTEINL